MHTLAQLCVRRPVFATMLILSLVVVGIFSYFSLGVDLFPKVDIPTVVVTGDVEGDQIRIISGLNPNDTVATSHQAELYDGAPVQVR